MRFFGPECRSAAGMAILGASIVMCRVRNVYKIALDVRSRLALQLCLYMVRAVKCRGCCSVRLCRNAAAPCSRRRCQRGLLRRMPAP